MTAPDFIAIAIADEEHRQGRPYLADSEHCARCAEIDEAWQQATCEHDERVNIRTVEDRFDQWLCQLCGHHWRGDPVPTVPPPPPLSDTPELGE